MVCIPVAPTYRLPGSRLGDTAEAHIPFDGDQSPDLATRQKRRRLDQGIDFFIHLA